MQFSLILQINANFAVLIFFHLSKWRFHMPNVVDITSQIAELHYNEFEKTDVE